MIIRSKLDLFIERCAFSAVKDVKLIPLLVLVFVIFSIYSFALLYNGTLSANRMAHDNMIFLDGIYRMSQGLKPHVDFSTGLGALNFYVGHWMHLFTDSIVEAFLFQNVLLLSIFLLICTYICLSRLQNITAIILLFYVASLVGAPTNVGEAAHSVTHAMFYNRFGWSVFLLTFLLFIPSRYSGMRITPYIESIVVAFFLVFTFYSKMTYFLAEVALLAVVLVLYFGEFRKQAILAGSFFIFSMLIFEITVPGIHVAYYSDLLEMRLASKGVVLDLFHGIKTNMHVMSLVVCSAVFLRVCYVRAKSYNIINHMIIGGGFTLLSVFLFENNAQREGIPSLIAFFLVMSNFFLRQEHSDLKVSAKVVLILLFAFTWIMPELAARHSSLSKFYQMGRKFEYSYDTPLTEKRISIEEGSCRTLDYIKQSSNDDDIKYRNLIGLGAEQEIYQSEYACLITDGYNVLRDLFRKYGEGGIVVFDFVNPFPLLLGSVSTEVGPLWFHADRNISMNHHPVAEEILEDALYVAIPSVVLDKDTNHLLIELYMEYLERNYHLVHEGDLWDVWLNRRLAPGSIIPSLNKNRLSSLGDPE